jgi:hypothetical protein
MTFEADGMKVTQPLDPYQGLDIQIRFEENMEEYALDHLYTLTTGKQGDYINPTADGLVSWWSIQSTGKIQRYLLTTGNREDMRTSQGIV